MPRRWVDELVGRSWKAAEDLLGAVRTGVSRQLESRGLDPEDLARQAADAIRRSVGGAGETAAAGEKATGATKKASGAGERARAAGKKATGATKKASGAGEKARAAGKKATGPAKKKPAGTTKSTTKSTTKKAPPTRGSAP